MLACAFELVFADAEDLDISTKHYESIVRSLR